MQPLSLSEIKNIELNILIFLDRICKENGLRYYLCGGTLLGAVRHQGFIPWDDDIDVSMPRPDYDKLLDLLSDNTEYSILAPMDKGYYYNFAKLVDSNTQLIEYGYNSISNMGIYIDIFPLEGMPDNDQTRRQHCAKLLKVRKQINSYSYTAPKLRKNIFAYLRTCYLYFRNKLISLDYWQKKYLQIASKYSYEKSQYVFASGGAYKTKDIFPKAFFSKGVNLQFENQSFTCPTEYSAYLTHLYGNYMQLPPEDKRVSHHVFCAYYKEQ